MIYDYRRNEEQKKRIGLFKQKAVGGIGSAGWDDSEDF